MPSNWEPISDSRTMPENSLLLPIRVLPLIVCPVTRVSCGGLLGQKDPTPDYHKRFQNGTRKIAFRRWFRSVSSTTV